MADTKLSGISLNITPDGRDRLYGISSVPASEALYLADANLMPDGFVNNYTFAVTVAANNITVALKTKSGADPSATDPVTAWIKGAYRRCTAALSVTKNAGTDYFLSGSRFPAVERDYFVYLVWNTTPATDIFDIGFSPLPYGRVFSDFSTTAATQNYMATANASAPTSTDDVIVIGRFAATLSAGAGYTWSVPTYTTTNFVRGPITETRWLSWTPTFTGFSVTPTGTHQYRVSGRQVNCVMEEGTGTSNTTGFTVTIPFTPANAVNAALMRVVDNGGGSVGMLAAATSTATMYRDVTGASWTASGTKYVQGRFSLEL